jgi:hypothetical protein
VAGVFESKHGNFRPVYLRTAIPLRVRFSVLFATPSSYFSLAAVTEAYLHPPGDMFVELLGGDPAQNQDLDKFSRL